MGDGGLTITPLSLSQASSKVASGRVYQSFWYVLVLGLSFRVSVQVLAILLGCAFGWYVLSVMRVRVSRI